MGRLPKTHQTGRLGAVKLNLLQLLLSATLGAAVLSLVSCSSTPKVEKTTAMAYEEGVPGGTLVEKYTVKTIVAGLEPWHRKVTVVAPDGSRNTFAASADFKDFDRLQIGDPVQAAVTRQLVIFLSKDAPRHNAATAAENPSPGVLRADTLQRTAKVGTVNTKRRQVVLLFEDGTSKAFLVRKDVDLRQVKPGDEVIIRTTSSVVLSRVKP